jgi:hypothetical protein
MSFASPRLTRAIKLNITLYKAADDLRQTLDQLDPETGELPDGYENALGLVKNKGRSVVAYYLDTEAQADMVELHAKELLGRVKTQRKRNEWLKGYLKDCMKTAGITEIKADDGSFKATFYANRDEAVVIDPVKPIPAKYLSDPAPLEPSKTKIKAALKAGTVLDFAYLAKNDRLEIK